jgi:hypothetical protein
VSESNQERGGIVFLIPMGFVKLFFYIAWNDFYTKEGIEIFLSFHPKKRSGRIFSL